jgi:hypothetical protein
VEIAKSRAKPPITRVIVRLLLQETVDGAWRKADARLASPLQSTPRA